MRMFVAGVLGMCVLLSAAGTRAEEQIEPVLEPNEDVLAVLDGLGENQSAMLPAATIAGDFNDESRRHGLDETGPRGRNFCQKAAWAPDRKRALFCGANHGVPHRLNDVWEYDLPSNTWYLLYAPDPSFDRNNREAFQAEQEERTHRIEPPDGEVEDVTIIHTKRGGPGRVAHTYWQLTYDPQLRVLLWLMPNGPHDPPMWGFYPQERRWEPVLYHGPRPSRGGAGAMEYIEDMGGVVWHNNTSRARGMRLFPSDENIVRNLAPNDANLRDNPNFPGAQAILSYDPEHRILVALWSKKTYHYEVDKNAWSLILDEPDDSESSPSGHYGHAAFGYDPVGKVHLRYDVNTPDSVWAYDVEKQEWERKRVDGPAGPTGNIIGYMDPARNVLVINDRRDVWVYRYKNE